MYTIKQHAEILSAEQALHKYKEEILNVLYSYMANPAAKHKERALSLCKAINNASLEGLTSLLVEQKALLEGNNPYPEDIRVSRHQQDVKVIEKVQFYCIIKEWACYLRKHYPTTSSYSSLPQEIAQIIENDLDMQSYQALTSTCYSFYNQSNKKSYEDIRKSYPHIPGSYFSVCTFKDLIKDYDREKGFLGYFKKEPLFIAELKQLAESLKDTSSKPSLTLKQLFDLWYILLGRVKHANTSAETLASTLEEYLTDPHNILPKLSWLYSSGFYTKSAFMYVMHNRASSISEVQTQIADTLFLEIKKLLENNNKEQAKLVLANPHMTESMRKETSIKLLMTCFERDLAQHYPLLTISLLSELGFDFNDAIYKKAISFVSKTPLSHMAENSTDVHILNALIDAGADVNIAWTKTFSPLHIAACEGNLEFVQILLKRGARLKQAENTLNACIRCPKKDTLPILKLLMPFKQDHKTELQTAIHYHQVEIAQFLLEQGVIYEGVVDTAILSGHIDLLKYVMQYAPLPKAIPYDNMEVTLDMFQSCVAQGMSPEYYPLPHRFVVRTPDAVQYLLNNTNVKSALDCKSYMAISRFVYGSWPGTYPCPFVHAASINAVFRSFAMLIAAGLNIHERDTQGYTPLHYAASYGNVDVVKALIVAGADINALDNSHRTPLHWAVKGVEGLFSDKHQILCAKVLLQAGACPEIKDNRGKIPLDRGSWDWKEAFQTKRQDKILQVYTGTNMPTLFQLTARTIATNDTLMQNFSYRKDISEDVASEIEKIACTRLEPK